MNALLEYEGNDRAAVKPSLSQTSIVLRDRVPADFFTDMASRQGLQHAYSDDLGSEFFCIPAFTTDLVLYEVESLLSAVPVSHTISAIAAPHVSTIFPTSNALAAWTIIKDAESPPADFYSSSWRRGEGVPRSNVFEFVAPIHKSYVAQSTTGAVPDTIVANWRAIYKSSFSDSTYLRLLHLAGMGENWNGADSRPLAPASLSRFLDFWRQVSDQASEPELVLTTSGTLQAEWYKDSTHLLEIDFALDRNETCYFGLFDGRRATIEGSGKLDDVVQICKAHRNGVALGWGGDSA